MQAETKFRCGHLPGTQPTVLSLRLPRKDESTNKVNQLAIQGYDAPTVDIPFTTFITFSKHSRESPKLLKVLERLPAC